MKHLHTRTIRTLIMTQRLLGVDPLYTSSFEALNSLIREVFEPSIQAAVNAEFPLLKLLETDRRI